MTPGARRGCLNSNHNDIARVNLELYISLNITTIFGSMKSVLFPTNLYPIEIILDYDIVCMSQVKKSALMLPSEIVYLSCEILTLAEF
jgi:hypothetical protein